MTSSCFMLIKHFNIWIFVVFDDQVVYFLAGLVICGLEGLLQSVPVWTGSTGSLLLLLLVHSVFKCFPFVYEGICVFILVFIPLWLCIVYYWSFTGSHHKLWAWVITSPSSAFISALMIWLLLLWLRFECFWSHNLWNKRIILF